MRFYLAATATATANSETRICVRNAVAAVALKASLVALANAQPHQDTYVTTAAKPRWLNGRSSWPMPSYGAHLRGECARR